MLDKENLKKGEAPQPVLVVLALIVMVVLLAIALPNLIISGRTVYAYVTGNCPALQYVSGLTTNALICSNPIPTIRCSSGFFINQTNPFMCQDPNTVFTDSNQSCTLVGSSIYQMMGFGKTMNYTTLATGNLFVSIKFEVNFTALAGLTKTAFQARYGTGAIPVCNQSPVGFTAEGLIYDWGYTTALNDKGFNSLTVVFGITGLNIHQNYWFDIQAKGILSTFTYSKPSMTVLET